jgi:cellulose synthase/poly-beta-1,6-N-acetylglucosamine synthase-like glycosyltransferase
MQQPLGTAVSVVVASHRKEYACALAAALLAHGTGAELLIVADYPVEELAEKFPGVTWKYLDDKSIPAKRNFGSRAATGHILAFIDDDCVPAADWLDAGVKYLEEHPEAGGVEGRTVIDAPADTSAPMAEFKRLERRGFRTNNIFYRKKVFFEAGGFDERFTVQREDADLAYSVLSRGYGIGYCEGAVVRHRVRENEKWDLLKNCVNRRFDPLLFKKHPALYREHVGTPFTPAIGLVLFFLVLALFSLAVFSAAWMYPLAAGIAAALVLAVRRNVMGRGGLLWILRDWLSFFLSPIVLTGALVYGSIKFRRYLLF